MFQISVYDRSDEEALAQLISTERAAKQTLQSMMGHEALIKINKVSNHHPNKKIETQRNFYTVKRKRKQRNNTWLTRPTTEKKLKFKLPKWIKNTTSQGI